MRQTGEDMNQFAMWQVFCWSARVMCLCISPLPIQASRIGFASSPRAYAFSKRERERQDLQSRLRMRAMVAHASSNGGKSSTTEQTDHGIA